MCCLNVYKFKQCHKQTLLNHFDRFGELQQADLTEVTDKTSLQISNYLYVFLLFV